MAATPHFTGVYGWKSVSYSCNPDIDQGITNVDYIKISYRIKTVGTVYINGTFNFQVT